MRRLTYALARECLRRPGVVFAHSLIVMRHHLETFLPSGLQFSLRIGIITKSAGREIVLDRNGSSPTGAQRASPATVGNGAVP
jgi:hypothetical protein